jgi:hypothetical protein
LGLIVPIITHAQPAQTTFTSTSFGAAEWTAPTVPFSAPVTGGTMSFTAETSDGNPGDFGRMVIQMPGNAACPSGSYGFAMRPSAVFDPGTSGAITGIDFTWDSRPSPVQGAGGAATLALEQGGMYWAALNRRVAVIDLLAGWQSFQLPGLVAADFTYASSWRQTGQALNPDFSESGAPITFGIANGVSIGFGGFDPECANPAPNGLDTDNWVVTVTATPPASPGQLEFEQSAYGVAETAGTAPLVVRRIAGTTGAVGVTYTTVAETATDGADYVGSTGTLSFADGVSTQPLPITILDDIELEGAETFRVELSNPTGGATLGPQDVTQVTIGDNEQGYDLALEIDVTPIYVQNGPDWMVSVELNVTARNLGPGPVTQPIVTISPLADYDYQSDDAGGLFYPNPIGQWIWALGSLQANESSSLRARFAKRDPGVGASLTLVGEIREPVPQTEPDLSNNQVNLTVPVGGADLSVTMQSSSKTVAGPAAVVYVAAYDVTIGDLAPAGEPARNAVVSFSAPGGSIGGVTPSVPGCAVVAGSAGQAWECQFAELTAGFTLHLEVSMTGPATATMNVSVSSDTYDGNLSNNSVSGTVFIPAAPGVNSNSGSCFIATAAYGSKWEPNVAILRQFRDRWLLTNAPGRAFVSFYYRVSPPIADWIAEREWARALTRAALTPIVIAIRHPLGAAGATGLALLMLGIWVRRRVSHRDDPLMS